MRVIFLSCAETAQRRVQSDASREPCQRMPSLGEAGGAAHGGELQRAAPAIVEDGGGKTFAACVRQSVNAVGRHVAEVSREARRVVAPLRMMSPMSVRLSSALPHRTGRPREGGRQLASRSFTAPSRSTETSWETPRSAMVTP